MSLADPRPFFQRLRVGHLLGPDLSRAEVDGCNALLDAFAAAKWPLSFAAYGLATAYHETGHTMQPVKEFGGPKYFAKYDTGRLAAALGNTPAADGDGIAFAGRGYVQITGFTNYKRASDELGVNFVKTPDLALNPKHAADIMVRGCEEGWFTGKAFRHYLPKNGPAVAAQFRECRRVINGTDRADLIAGYAVEFQRALQAGVWQ